MGAGLNVRAVGAVSPGSSESDVEPPDTCVRSRHPVLPGSLTALGLNKKSGREDVG